MKSLPHILLITVGMLLLFFIGMYNLLEIFGANWLPDVVYEWTSEVPRWGNTVKIATFSILLLLPIFTLVFFVRSRLSPKPIICKHGASVIKLSQKSITRSLKEVLHRIPAIVSVNIKVWNKSDKVFVDIGSVVRAGAMLPELNEEIKLRTRETLHKILGIENIGPVKSIIDDIKFSDKEVVGRVFESRVAHPKPQQTAKEATTQDVMRSANIKPPQAAKEPAINIYVPKNNVVSAAEEDKKRDAPSKTDSPQAKPAKDDSEKK